MRVLLIGGTGFIGRHVAAKLVEGGHAVAIVHRGKTQALLPQAVHHITGDRSKINELRDEFWKWAPDVVIDMILSSAWQARATLDAFHGIARRVVAVSSGDVYRAMALVHRLEDGPLEPVPLTEESPLRSQRHTYSPEALKAG